MSATNATSNYSFPLFIGTDKPAWLVDWNSAMTAIDAQIKINATAILANETAISGLSTTVSAHTTSISTISGQITTLTTGLNTAQGNINTINSLIGNGTPTTTDQTLIGAINELHANQGSLASLATTDKTSLVAAINEIVGGTGGGIAASAVSYNNTSSGLTATDVQAAIDELAQGGSSTVTPVKIGTYTSSQTGVTADLSSYNMIAIALTGDSDAHNIIAISSIPKSLLTASSILGARYYDTSSSANRTVNISNISNSGFDVSVGVASNQAAAVFAW